MERVEKQTAVEWFYFKLLISKQGDNKTIMELFKQAKAMEKEQIIDAFDFGVYDGGGIIKKYKMSGEQYYNKTFKSE